MPAGFDVWVPDLDEGARSMGTDAEAVTTAGSDGAGAARDAGAGIAGPLAVASAAFATALTDGCSTMSTATDAAGTTLAGNATTYRLGDGTASTSLGGVGFGAP